MLELLNHSGIVFVFVDVREGLRRRERK